MIDGADGKEQVCRSTLIGSEPSVIPAHTHVEIQRVAHAHMYKSRYKTVQSDRIPQGNRIKLWPRQGFHEGNLVKSLHGIDVS